MSEFKKITGEVKISDQISNSISESVKSINDFKIEIEKTLEKKTTEILEMILSGAIILGCSDIHIEPEEELAKIRVRIDGILQNVLNMDRKIFKALVSRIKLLSELKLNVSDRPQDGRFSILFKKIMIEIRASSLPSEYGESIVMRILNPENLIDVESLGLREDVIETFHSEIKKPYGMIIVTGPTGSGKTTTLYAVLKKLNKPEVKIITIEDPIEYHLEGISQTQVDPKKGYNFASGLKSMMRQDPDIILVGEIRDLETAQIAIQASLTGHLVFSTLHTNDAAGAIARLQSLGEKSENISPAVNMIVGQRLTRKVCSKCKSIETASEEEVEKLKKAFSEIPQKILSSILPKDIKEIKSGIKIPKAKGCKLCNNTGYKGRVGIYELFIKNSEMEKFILTSPSIIGIKEFAVKNGMIPMKQDGFLKVLEGETTIEEVERVAEN